MGNPCAAQKDKKLKVTGDAVIFFKNSDLHHNYLACYSNFFCYNYLVYIPRPDMAKISTFQPLVPPQHLCLPCSAQLLPTAVRSCLTNTQLSSGVSISEIQESSCGQ